MGFTVNRIGFVRSGNDGFEILLDSKYAKGLKGLGGFGCLQVLWWCDRLDNEQARAVRTVERPYVKGPNELGVFATRSPARPNPIAVSVCHVLSVDEERGVIKVAWIDAFDGTPVIDIKPYTPSADRVEYPKVPNWCAHWPMSVESSGDFDWDAEFNF